MVHWYCVIIYFESAKITATANEDIANKYAWIMLLPPWLSEPSTESIEAENIQCVQGHPNVLKILSSKNFLRASQLD